MFPVPGYISRSVAGSYDNEGIAIFALMFTYYLWVGIEDVPSKFITSNYIIFMIIFVNISLT